MDEEKLKSYKLKKLKSEFEYLRTVLEECQYIYELSLEMFSGSISNLNLDDNFVVRKRNFYEFIPIKSVF